MKRYVTLLLTLGMLPSAWGIADEPADATASVAAWNIYGLRTITDTRAKNIARGLADLDAEVVVLSEVRPDGIVATLIEEARKLGVEYEHALKAQTADLNIAILHKKGVTVTDPEFIAGSNLGNADLRKAFTAKVRVGKFDFLIVGLHLKSGRTSSSRNTRTRQCKIIAEWVEDNTAGAEKDVLILGDFNMIRVRDQENFDTMNPADDLRFISSEIKEPDFTHIGSSGDPGNFLDGFAITREHTGEYIETSAQVLQLHKTLGMKLSSYRTNVTDHLPLVARFRVNKDDD